MAALLCSYLYVGVIVAAGEAARRLGAPGELARKIIHVGVGLWVFGTLALFTDRWLAVIPPLTAAAGNWYIHRKRLLKAVEAPPENLGTVWFPVSFAALILAFWQTPAAVAGGVMAMTIGDAAASLVGVPWGWHRYHGTGGAVKSLEGSAAMFVATLVTVGATIAGLGVAAPLALPLALLTAVVTTCAEALGARGQDNLWVPLSGGLVIWLGLTALAPATVAGLSAGAGLALLIGAAAWLKGSLSPSGALGAVLTGTLVFGLGGWTGGLALVGFFLSSSLLSRVARGHRAKAEAEADYAKTGTRDFGQTLANGGVAAAAALAYGLTRDPRWLGALLGSLAAANADTWATEVGVLSPSAPRMITTWKPARPGASGAVSLTGTAAALAGAAFVGACGAAAAPSLWPRVPLLALAGLAGALADSLLGATLQSVYWCPACARETERPVHRCGTAALRYRGVAWLGNDLVNLLATAAGALLGFLAV